MCKVQPASVTLSAYGFHSTFFYKVSFVSYIVPCKRRKGTVSTGEYAICNMRDVFPQCCSAVFCSCLPFALVGPWW